MDYFASTELRLFGTRHEIIYFKNTSQSVGEPTKCVEERNEVRGKRKKTRAFSQNTAPSSQETIKERILLEGFADKVQ